MNTQRVLFVDHTGVLGGAELSLLDIATALEDRCAVALFEHGPFEERLIANGVQVHVLDNGVRLRGIKKDSALPSFGALAATFSLGRELARLARGYSLLYANSPKSFLVSTLAGALARRPVAWHVRDIVDRTHFSAANIRLLTRTANWRAARVVTNSEATAAAFVSSGGNRALVRVVHNGIDPTPFDTLPLSTRGSMRGMLGIGPSSYVLGSFSRLHPWKGHRVLFDALDAMPDIHALIVGGALFSGEESFEQELRDRASTPPLKGRVHMLGARSDIPELMATCDAVVHTSIAPEPFGRVIVEAMLAHRPVVASNAGGVREIVQDGVTGLLTTPGDAGALADAIHKLRADPYGASAMADAAQMVARRQFSRDAMIANVTREIDEMLGAAS